jgi:RHS repeat-associated protein
LGSVDAVTDSDGALVSEQRYLPFGGVRTDAGTVTQTDIGYTNEYTSQGLVNLRSRLYDPSIGRFLTKDSW